MADNTPLNLRFASYVLDESNARLSRDGTPLALPPKAFDVLCALARQPGALVTKDGLLDAVWGHRHVSESVLKTTVSELRAALGDDARSPRFIETAARRGYRFIAPLENASPSAQAHPAPSPGIVGRGPELQRLRTAWQYAQSGQRQLVWVVGEAGVGKTTLLEHFLAELPPGQWACGQCVEQFGAGEPYLPILEALDALCRHDQNWVTQMRRVAPTWLMQMPWRLDPEARAALAQEMAGANQDRMLRELRELIDSHAQPLCLLIEDLHWSDQATLRLIEYFARSRTSSHVLWLASFRLAEVVSEEHSLKALRQELRLHRLADELMLDAFSEQEISDYLATRAPAAAGDESFVRALHQRTEGLPLYLVNVIEELDAAGALAGAPAANALATLAVPDSLAGLIDKHLMRLAPAFRSVLEAASLFGNEFRPRTLADALEQDVNSVAAICETLVAGQHWLASFGIERMPDGILEARYGFRHALYRDALIRRLGALTRARLHHRIATSLEQDRSRGVLVSATELASHYELGHDTPAAVRFGLEAIDNALRHFAPGEAMELANRALALIPRCAESPQRDAQELALHAMRGVANAQLLGVSALETKYAFERAYTLLASLPGHPLRGIVLQGLGLVLLMRGEYDATRTLGQTLADKAKLFDDRILSLCACNLLGQTCALQGQQRDGEAWLAQGVADCDALGDPVLLASFVVDPATTLYSAHAISLLHAGRIDQAHARLRHADERATRLRQPMARMVALWFNALIEVRLDNPARVGAIATMLAELVDTAGLAQAYGPSRWFRAWADARLGDATAARAAHRRILDAYQHNTRLGMLAGSAEVLGYATEALILAEDWQAAREQLATAYHQVETTGEHVYLTQMHLLEARIALALNDLDAACRATQAALAEARRQASPWLELKAAVALCELPKSAVSDRAQLATVREKISQGLDSALVQRADTLLSNT